MKYKNNLAFLFTEFLTLICNIAIYKVLITLNINSYFSSIISLVISSVLNYLFCQKYVFHQSKKSCQQLKKFIIYVPLAYLLKKVLFKLLNNSLQISLIFSKLIALITITIINYFIKRSIFEQQYKFSLNQKLSILENKWNKLINLKYLNLFFQILPQNFFLFLFFLGSLYYTLTFIRDNDDILLYKQTISNDTIGAILEPVEITFDDIEFTETETTINKICLVFGTYGRTNNSNLTFELYNQNQEKQFTKEINTNTLTDGQGFCLHIPQLSVENLSTSYLKIIPTNTDDSNNVTLFIDKENQAYTMYLKQTHNLLSIKYLIILVYLIIFFIINYYINKHKDKISENKYLLIMTIYIISILFITPPLQNPDEPSHLYSAYNLSQNGINADETTEIIVPNNIECLNYSNLKKTDRVVDYQEINNCLKNSENEQINAMFGVSNTVENSVLGHTIPAIFIKIIDTFTNSPLVIFYFSRLGNFLVSFIILYFAIKLAPVGKKLLLFIGLIPIFIQQETSLSYDAIINSISLLYLAYIIKHLHNKDKIKLPDIIIPVISITIMYTIKIIYVPLAFLLLLIPKEKFQTNKQRLFYYISIIALVTLGNYLITEILFQPTKALANESVSQQMSYLLNNPLAIFTIAINTFKRKGWFYLQSLFGLFSWFSFSLSDFTIIACLIYLILLIATEKNLLSPPNNSKINLKKIILALAILVSLAGIFGSMYLCWSEYMLDYVEGVQGRYLIPLIGPIALLFMPKKEKISLTKDNLYFFLNILLIQHLIYYITFFY